MHRRAIYLLLGTTLLASLAIAQQVKKSRTATVTAQSMDFDWSSNTFVFSGNAKLSIGGDMEATMSAPTVTFSFDEKAKAIKNLIAKGPVQFTVVTKPGADGSKRKIVASASQEATYSEDTQIVKLVGSAVADMLPLEGNAAEAVHFTGETITANLKTNRLTVDNANVTVRTETE